mmetsp:Transcript_7367/g.9812  ORF Transcript_7367/g.9812 Transcript_7367/m.9812 type:complete len:80 (+) Transcript_7367:90-329(+)
MSIKKQYDRELSFSVEKKDARAECVYIFWYLQHFKRKASEEETNGCSNRARVFLLFTIFLFFVHSFEKWTLKSTDKYIK